MPRDRQQVGPCPQCQQPGLDCTYNHFAGPHETIDSWEHRCANCGHRTTQAFRAPAGSDADARAAVCPFCGRTGNPAV